ncbi:MAG: hypothetical protein KKB90_04575 [Actinobacteria bacterium]|nr:hypothetical protein [Actinomycetota bacterium]MCG2818591.1 hypothetical protein [Actinomycetes bacterium]MBU4179731.1 hypothetical protein [Actinomycetota bacterium]MBU4218220.1 hypothetical protein [Actinomycetota bacterium]MBU4358645.1 hypothetical protein [Actinomycetota bacterium]
MWRSLWLGFFSPPEYPGRVPSVLTGKPEKEIKVDDIPGLEATEFATRVEVTNNVPVVCERAMYFKYDGKSGGHDSIGYALTD